MAVKIRLRREGKKKQPYYRVVVADVRAPRDGRFIDDIGYYQPLHEPSTVSIDRDRALKWLRDGAQPSDAVVNLLRIEGIWEEFRPGDPGKDRSAKHAARAAKAAERENEARRQADAAQREREAAEAAAAPREAPPPETPGEATGGEATPGEATAAQAREEVTQPDPLPPEDAGALPPSEDVSQAPESSGGEAVTAERAEAAISEEEQP